VYYRATSSVQQATLERMNAILTHRGPDGSGFVLLGKTALSMSRLRIIDLTTGDQPIPNEDETCWIIYNGEIHNFLDLRRELEATGQRFRTRSDTEVILHAYDAWGPDCVHRLEGTFAFAVHDGRPQPPAAIVCHPLPVVCSFWLVTASARNLPITTTTLTASSLPRRSRPS
jgi:asparagine synthase (glutamine-hydrolysing)